MTVIASPTAGGMTLEPYGPNAWLLRFAEHTGEQAFKAASAITRELAQQPPSGLIESVPGYTTVLLEFAPDALGGRRTELEVLLLRLAGKCDEPYIPGPLREIVVSYDGLDLNRVMEHTGFSRQEVVERHCAPEYRVDLIGFAPGFPYLNGLDADLATPRLDQPRVRVEAGSVAIGGEHTGIYSIASSGGWNLIGQTDVKLFDPESARCLLAPGDRVRFKPRTL